MALQSDQLHFVMFPFHAQGHLVPMVDIAKLLAKQGIIVSVVTTPLNAKRIERSFVIAQESGLQMQLLRLQLPSEEAGLPKDCENVDKLPSLVYMKNFFMASNMCQDQAEKLFQDLKPKPSCIISDVFLIYTTHIAKKFGIPRITFNGLSCFSVLCFYRLCLSNIVESINSDFKNISIPGLPENPGFTRKQIQALFIEGTKEFIAEATAADLASNGIIMNSFEELEPEIVKEFKKIRENKVWCIGPVSLCNEDKSEKVTRRNKALADESESFNWLSKQNQASVLYVCFGSVGNLTVEQLVELALGLEASNMPFLWVIRGENTTEFQNWLEEFEERTEDRGTVIQGWAPQVAILSHPAIGGFLTHCGWNSVLESVSAGVPMLTWPLFGDQFFNEKLIAEVMRIGEKVEAEITLNRGEEEKIGVLVKREDVKNAVNRLMQESEEKEQRLKRVKELSKKANAAIEENGSSNSNLKSLIEDVRNKKI